jgi:hypothetical protein
MTGLVGIPYGLPRTSKRAFCDIASLEVSDGFAFSSFVPVNLAHR